MDSQIIKPKTPASALDRLATLANYLGGVALLGVVCVQVWQVFARYVLNASPSWTEPVAGLFLSTTMSLGAAVMVHREAHFGFVLLRDGLPAPWRAGLKALVDVAIAVVGIAFAVWGCQLLIDGWSIALAGISLPQSAPYAPLALGGALMALFAIAGLWRRLRAGRRS